MIIKISPNYIEKFVIKTSIKNKGKVLDAGAGNKPYKKYFRKEEYESADIKGNQTYLCSLENIPVNKNNYERILCTQVLEHVKEPDKVLKEFNRILKKNGELILTVPQSYHIHEEPENYFTYTKYGIKYLLEKNGFKIKKIETQGKWYYYLADQFRNANRKNFHIFIFIWPISEIFFPIIGLLFDKFDKTELQSLGYNILAKKVGKKNV